MNNRTLQLFISLVLIIIMCLTFIGCKRSDEEKDKKIREEYFASIIETDDIVLRGKLIDSTSQVIKAIYVDNQEKQDYWQSELNKLVLTFNNESTTNTSFNDILKIENLNWKIEKDLYNYTTGKLKNISNKDIKYFEITINYIDSNGNVIDSDYTNSGQTLYSGNSKEFEVMHKNNDDYVKIEAFVSEIQYQ